MLACLYADDYLLLTVQTVLARGHDMNGSLGYLSQFASSPSEVSKMPTFCPMTAIGRFC
ncbi:hypothetical protein HK44_001465 [Pseudomonas fluorescens HK44]|uniref:Uncharacterized protein n=1 Tax=Pseudomonas fluorescens HK44 TaxID=1042209 RepID=A0A010SUR3_PSEFL|nr:hypothetical protein HK44_001465 [Pseudomonas fluorescens HK44]